MVNIDALAEGYYSSKDPQYQEEVIPDVTEDWATLYEMLDDASTIINRIIDSGRTEEALVTSTLISAAMVRAEREATR